MILRRIRNLCRGTIMLLFLVAMSVSLTGCAGLASFLAVLGPVLNTLGAIGGTVGSIVGIFNPDLGQKISQVSGAVSQAGQGFSATAQQMSQNQAMGTGSTLSSTNPTVRSASTRSEDGDVLVTKGTPTSGGEFSLPSFLGLSGKSTSTASSRSTTNTSPTRSTTVAPVSAPATAGNSQGFTNTRFTSAPVTVNSGYGMRTHPIYGDQRMHNGVDVPLPAGTPLQALGDGVVTSARTAGGAGKMVTVRYDNGYESTYMHMQGFDVKEGARVKQGDQVGRVDSTGSSTGNHLHFEVKNNGKRVDPRTVPGIQW